MKTPGIITLLAITFLTTTPKDGGSTDVATVGPWPVVQAA